MKKRAIFFTSYYDDTTGGTKVNKNIIEIIKTTGLFDFEIITKAKTEDLLPKKLNFINRMFFYWNILKKQDQIEYFFTNHTLGKSLFFVLFDKKIIRKNTKIITFMHHFGFHSYTGLRRLVCRCFEVNLLKRSNFIIFACKPTYDISGFIKETESRKKVLIENIVPKVEIPNAEKIQNRICFTGRIEQIKGIHELILAMAIVKRSYSNFELLLMGSYDETTSFFKGLQRIIYDHQMNENIRFCGRVSDDELYSTLASSRFFVFPSHLEGYGLSIVEAMQFSLPVIAWDTSAMPYLVKDNENGFLVKHKDIQAFAEAIVKLYNDDEVLQRLSIGAKNTFDKTPDVVSYETQVREFAKRLISL